MTTVRVMNDIEEVMVNVEFKDDHFAELARRGTITVRNVWINCIRHYCPTIHYKDLIEALKEMD